MSEMPAPLANGRYTLANTLGQGGMATVYGGFDTMLEVGSWAWNWMEPALGQLSFFILCVQLSKNYMQSIGMTPYIDYLLKSRATSLKEMYPQYHASIVNDFAIGQWYDHSSPSDEHGIK